MLSKLIYQLDRIEIGEHENENKIICHCSPSGFFDSKTGIVDFIKKHTKQANYFYVVKAWVFNPTHVGQTEDNLFEYTLNSEGEVICENPTHHFVVTLNELNGNEKTIFTGRNDDRLNKGDIAWFYDEYDCSLNRCKVGELPFDKDRAQQCDILEWRDDSYLVYPYPIPPEDNHQHIISCYMFTERDIDNMAPKAKPKFDDNVINALLVSAISSDNCVNLETCKRNLSFINRLKSDMTESQLKKYEETINKCIEIINRDLQTFKENL